jgi:transposase
MRPLKSHFPDHALTTLETMLKQTKEARIFRRAQAVHAVVAGQHVSAVSATFHLANSALRKWVQRFANQGPQGLLDRPRPGRPRKVTCALEQHLNHLVDQDPPPAWLPVFPMELARTRDRVGPTDRYPARP